MQLFLISPRAVDESSGPRALSPPDIRGVVCRMRRVSLRTAGDITVFVLARRTTRHMENNCRSYRTP